MKITLAPTGHFHKVNGQDCRVWTGETDQGIAVRCFIPLVEVRADADNSAFEAELREVHCERELVSFDYRFVI